MKLIDKDALVAEIEKWLGETDKGFPNDHNLGRYDMCKQMLSFLDTLEVKEVDLEKEIDNAFLENKCNITDNVSFAEFVRIAKHFFELGIKAAQKG